MALKVWLPLNGDFRNLGADDITFSGTQNGFANEGKIGSQSMAIKLDTNYKFTVPSLVNSHVFSLAFWHKANKNANLTGNWSRNIVLTTYNADGTSGSILRFETSYGMQNNASYSISLHNNTSYSILSSSQGGMLGIAWEEWHHFAFCTDGVTCYIYRDGTLWASCDNQGGSLTGTVNLGYPNGTSTNDSELNDVRLYDHCLSQKEVKEISQGLVCHYKLDDVAVADSLDPSATWILYNNIGQTKLPSTLTKTGDYYRGGTVYRTVFTPTNDSISQVRGGGKSARGVYNWRRTWKANTKYVFWIYYKLISSGNVLIGGTASNIGGWTEIPSQSVGDGWYVVGQYRNGTVTSDKTDSVYESFYYPNAQVGEDIIIDWASPHILEGTTEIPADFLTLDTTVYDCSGYGNNGIAVGGLSISTDTPRNSYSMWFSGTQYIKNTNFIFDSNIWTASIWYYRATSPSNYETLFSLSKGNAATDSNKKIYAGLYTSNRYWCKAESSGATISGGVTGEWALFTMSCNGTTARIYVNNTQISTLSVGTALTGRTDLYIGARTNSDDGSTIARGLNGGLSDFRLYATALSASDIKDLYETSASIDNKGNIYAYEFLEDGESLGIEKSGIVKSKETSVNDALIWLPLNGDLNNFGSFSTTMSNSNASVNENGRFCSCYSFNGSTSCIIGTPAPLGNSDSEWSFACWFKPNTSHTGCLFSNRTAVSATGISIFYYTSSFYVDDGTRWSTSSADIIVGKWNHIVVTRKLGTGKYLYVNGTLSQSTSTTANATIANSTGFIIGRSGENITPSGANNLNGYLNDVRIYNRCLSATEVADLYYGNGFIEKGSATNASIGNKYMIANEFIEI